MAATKRASEGSRTASSKISGQMKIASEAKRSAVTALAVAHPRFTSSHLLKMGNRLSLAQGQLATNFLGSRNNEDSSSHSQSPHYECCCPSSVEADIGGSNSALVSNNRNSTGSVSGSLAGVAGLSGMKKNKSTTVGYRLGKRKLLYERRKRISDYCLIFALLGIAVMVVEAELCIAEVFTKVGF